MIINKFSRPSILLAGTAIFGLLIGAVLYFQPAGAKPLRQAPIDVIRAYLKASYARDYGSAYRYISSQDRRVWDERSYAVQSGAFTGFALELAQTLADGMEVWTIDRKQDPHRAHYKIGYRVPTADELSSLLFDWNPDKLNALSRPRQVELLETLAKMKKTGKMIMIEGQETFDLVLDKSGWKIFLDWASGIKVRLKATSLGSNEIEARFVQNELIAKKDEPFQIDLKIENRSTRPMVARIVHHIEPREMEDQIDMIACGALRPLALQPGEVQEISSAYVIKGGPVAGSEVGVTYEIKQESQGVYSKPNAPTRTTAKAN
jgi:hypothetical protein